ncbi:hypothetical protein AST01_09990 [Staphylococcus equorum]|uniref:nucleotidyl transferase AbiEii/AbiGii toxin family protein n=1 Tax=Staphylococcus equorum TaxID=246432 RepID=UPI0008533413|nr:nucleotidyl transferase AbiEii/AbiGii toxin family protein [Staphylococcus equorum]OEK66668.1 hypothetical protein AST01_09990 [Staphylococcus equorum]
MKIYDESTKNNIRKLIITGIFADDLILGQFALKGGNALSMAHNLSERASMDIDLSMKEDIDSLTISREELKDTLQQNIAQSLEGENLTIIDFTLNDSPRKTNNKFWGGYRITFKVVDNEEIQNNNNDIDSIRKLSISLGKSEKKEMKIDISKYEFIDNAILVDCDDDSLINVYSLTMIISEKLRAICQQMPEYKEKMKVKTSPRPRDFYDIYTIIESKPNLGNDLMLGEIKSMMREIFRLKDVPLSLLENVKLEDTKEFHEKDFETVLQTIYATSHRKEFDFYYSYVCNLIEKLNLNN